MPSQHPSLQLQRYCSHAACSNTPMPSHIQAVKRRAASPSSGLRSPDTLCRRASHFAVENLYLSAPSNSPLPFLPACLAHRGAEIRANFHKIKKKIVSLSAHLLTARSTPYLIGRLLLGEYPRIAAESVPGYSLVVF